MAYWNHFATCPYDKIKFNDLSVDEIFRSALWHGKQFRGYIICVKTGSNTYIEKKSKKEHKLHSPQGYEIYKLLNK